MQRITVSVSLAILFAGTLAFAQDAALKEPLPSDDSSLSEDAIPDVLPAAEDDGVAEGKYFSPYPVKNYSGDLMTRPALTGDWAGIRNRWAENHSATV